MMVNDRCETDKKKLEKLDRLSLWRIVTYPNKRCPNTVWLAAKVYAERTMKDRPGPRDGYYGKDLLEDVIKTIDDKGNLKQTEKRSRVVEFIGLVDME